MMNITKNYNSTGAKGNALPITQPDRAVVDSVIKDPEKQCIKIHGKARNVWLINVEMYGGDPDNCTVHRGEPGSEDIEYVMIVDCKSYRSRKEQSYDCTVGKWYWLINSEGDEMNIGHEVNYVILVNPNLKRLKIKASDNVFLVNGSIGELKFEKQGDAGSGVGKDQGPRKVHNFNCKIGNKNLGNYADAYKEIDALPSWLVLPEVPEDLVEYLKTPYVIEGAVYEDGTAPIPVEEPSNNTDTTAPSTETNPGTTINEPVTTNEDEEMLYVYPGTPIKDDLRRLEIFVKQIIAKI